MRQVDFWDSNLAMPSKWHPKHRSTGGLSHITHLNTPIADTEHIIHYTCFIMHINYNMLVSNTPRQWRNQLSGVKNGEWIHLNNRVSCSIDLEKLQSYRGQLSEETNAVGTRMLWTGEWQFANLGLSWWPFSLRVHDWPPSHQILPRHQVCNVSHQWSYASLETDQCSFPNSTEVSNPDTLSPQCGYWCWDIEPGFALNFRGTDDVWLDGDVFCCFVASQVGHQQYGARNNVTPQCITLSFSQKNLIASEVTCPDLTIDQWALPTWNYFMTTELWRLNTSLCMN